MQAVEDGVAAPGGFFASLGGLFANRSGGRNFSREDKAPFSAADRPEALWNPIDENRTLLVSACAKILLPVQAILESFDRLAEAGLDDADAIRKELEAQVLWIGERVGDLDFAMKGDEEN